MYILSPSICSTIHTMFPSFRHKSLIHARAHSHHYSRKFKHLFYSTTQKSPESAKIPQTSDQQYNPLIHNLKLAGKPQIHTHVTSTGQIMHNETRYYEYDPNAPPREIVEYLNMRINTESRPREFQRSDYDPNAPKVNNTVIEAPKGPVYQSDTWNRTTTTPPTDPDAGFGRVPKFRVITVALLCILAVLFDQYFEQWNKDYRAFAQSIPQIIDTLRRLNDCDEENFAQILNDENISDDDKLFLIRQIDISPRIEMMRQLTHLLGTNFLMRWVLLLWKFNKIFMPFRGRESIPRCFTDSMTEPEVREILTLILKAMHTETLLKDARKLSILHDPTTGQLRVPEFGEVPSPHLHIISWNEVWINRALLFLYYVVVAHIDTGALAISQGLIPELAAFREWSEFNRPLATQLIGITFTMRHLHQFIPPEHVTDLVANTRIPAEDDRLTQANVGFLLQLFEILFNTTTKDQFGVDDCPHLFTLHPELPRQLQSLIADKNISPVLSRELHAFSTDHSIGTITEQEVPTDYSLIIYWLLPMTLAVLFAARRGGAHRVRNAALVGALWVMPVLLEPNWQLLEEHLTGLQILNQLLARSIFDVSDVYIFLKIAYVVMLLRVVGFMPLATWFALHAYVMYFLW